MPVILEDALRTFIGTFVLLALTIASTGTAPAQATAGSIGGTVTSESGGAAVSSATVVARGPITYTAITDAKGAFSIANVVVGPYQITVSKGGFTTLETNAEVTGGAAVTVNVRLSVASFSSLKTIASVRTTRAGNFNTSTASVSVVTAQQFALQGATQVGPVLSEIPGVQISLPGSDANGAVPGAITFPNVRNGLSYETATLIDGHPVAVGGYGDYVVTFLNPALLQSAEIVKGPGADAPEVTGAINGSINFRTKDPTADLQTFYSFGAHNFGGGVYDLGASDTLLRGRLGFVVGIAGDNDFSAVNNSPIYFDPGSGSGYLGTTNLYPYGCNGPNPILGTNPNRFYSRVYNNCTAVATTTIYGQYNSLEELFKLRYKLSERSYLTASYFGGQANANQSGNLSNIVQSIFNPGYGYTGSLKPGSVVDVLSSAYNAQPQYETNNEPIFQMEFSTAFKDDTFIARFYHATIDRVIQTGLADPFTPLTQNANVYGTLDVSGLAPFNGQNVSIAQYNYFNQVELDQLTGYSVEYTHPFGTSNELSMAINYNDNATQGYYNEFSYGGNQCNVGSVTLGGFSAGCYDTVTSLPAGSGQNFTTVLLRDIEQFSPKLSGMLSLYQNVYHSSYPTNCANYSNPANGYETVCLSNGILQTYNGGTPDTFVSNVPVTFGSTTLHSFDPRAGLTWRPQNNVAVRASAGASIAPPYLALLGIPNDVITPPTEYGHGNPAVETINSGNLRPETAWGYDLGADYAFKDGVTFVSGDGFLTSLYNPFFNEYYPSGTVCGSACGKPETPLYYSQYINLSNARYEGIELTLKRIPQAGWGFVLAGSTQRGYPFNLPPTFYCSFVISAKRPCVPANYNVNLNILSGQNYYGEYVDNGGGATSGVDNQSVPYLQGNASVSYTFRNHAFLSFGETLYGKNNSYNRPPFGVAYATASYPLSKDFAFQVSGYNLFNAYSQLFPLYGGGVTVPLANGQSAGTIGNVLGPARYLFLVTKAFGAGQ